MLEKLSLSIALYSWSFWFLCFTLPPDFFHIYSKTTPPKKPATFFVVRDFFFSSFLSDCGRLCTNLLSVCSLAPITYMQDPNFSGFLSSFPSPGLDLCGLSPVPCLSLSWRVTPVPLTPAPLPGPRRNAPGLVIAFVGAIELYGWLKLPNLTVRWTLNGAQRGAALQPAAAAKFLQWRPAITPTQTAI